MAKPVNRIRHVGADRKNSYTYYPVAIIGAGESGIAMGCRLKSVLGCDQFRIFERKSGLGGTWYGNRYPGIACDIPALAYSYSWAQNPHWSSPFPTGDEIVQYLYDVCEKFQVMDKMQFNTSVKLMQWIEAEEEWEIVLEHLAASIGDMTSSERKQYEEKHGEGSSLVSTEKVRAKVVCSAAGGLVEPKSTLDVPGRDTFEGQVMHTARWDSSIDLKEKDVVIVGTGCSAAQVMPQLIKQPYSVKHVTQLLRSPPWATPYLPRSAMEWWENNMAWYCTYVPGFQFFVRKALFTVMELEFVQLFSPTEAARQRRAKKADELLGYIKKAVPPEYQEILTPNYEVFCKRRVVDVGWYKSLHDPKAEITSLPLTAMGPGKQITLGPGRHYPPESDTSSTAPTDQKTIPCDVLIMASGYETNAWLHPLKVIGKHGMDLGPVWKERGGAQAYLGIAMDGFPNFFTIFGPNTATGHSSVILASENMVNYALKFIRPILTGEVTSWEVKESAERKWTADIQRELQNSVFNKGGAKNWYTSPEGWNSTTYPRTQVDFTLRCMFPVWSHWDARYTPWGRLRMWSRRGANVVMLFGALAALVYTVRYGTLAARGKLQGLVEFSRRGLVRGLDVLRARTLAYQGTLKLL